MIRNKAYTHGYLITLSNVYKWYTSFYAEFSGVKMKVKMLKKFLLFYFPCHHLQKTNLYPRTHQSIRLRSLRALRDSLRSSCQACTLLAIPDLPPTFRCFSTTKSGDFFATTVLHWVASGTHLCNRWNRRRQPASRTYHDL